MRIFSRRGFTGAFLASLLANWRGAAVAQAAPGQPLRHYRADAAILLFGITIYRRAGIGSGQASIEETGAGGGLQRTFFFAAGSDPKRTHGQNRLGWIREVVIGPGAAPAEATYFGVLTSSPEESLEHARKTANTPQAARSLYSAVSGRHTAGHSRSAITHFDFPSDAGWSDQRLIHAAQSRFQDKIAWRETSWPKSPDRAPATFLLELATLLQQRAPRAAGQYVYNEQEYRMEIETGQPADHLLPVRGKIRNLRTRRQTTFLLWIAEAGDNIAPVRIQYQARSFLRLTFESVPG